MKLLEKPDRLSRSLIWDLQKHYYSRQGMAAWGEGRVPSFMSANAFLADAYAEIITGFIADHESAPGPVRIVELGAGAGRLAFLLLKRLAGRGLAGRFHYVMTDIAGSVIDSWRESGLFQDFLDAGQVRFDILDADDRDQARRMAGRDDDPSGPVVVIANYVVDTLRQDAFRTSGGKVFECRAAAGTAAGLAREDPEIIKHVELAREYHAARAPYYDDLALDSVLSDYGERLDEAGFLIPIGFLRFLGAIEPSAEAPLLALVGDRGRLDDEELNRRGDPDLVLHDGCFSLSTNFNALGRFMHHRAGAFLASSDLDRGFILAALLDDGGGRAERLVGTRQAFERAVGRLSPRDTVVLMRAMLASADRQPLDAIVALLKLCGCDTRVMADFSGRILELAPHASARQRRQLVAVMERVWDNHYPLGTTRDVPYRVGRVFDGLGETERAAELYRASLAERGDTARTLYRLARCLEKMGATREAKRRAEQCLRLDPDDQFAARLAERLS